MLGVLPSEVCMDTGCLLVCRCRIECHVFPHIPGAVQIKRSLMVLSDAGGQSHYPDGGTTPRQWLLDQAADTDPP